MEQRVYDNLYHFTERGGQMSLPVHQYLLASEPSLMIATGSFDQARWILPQIDVILRHKPLDYLFISHMESDECGGVSLFVKKYPNITILCSAFTARELKGYGIKAKTQVCDSNKSFDVGDLSLRFIRYPSEVHMNEGILFVEMKRGIFYSSDLIMHHILNGQLLVEGDLEHEISAIDCIHNIETVRREQIKADIRTLSPRFIATGHGACINIK